MNLTISLPKCRAASILSTAQALLIIGITVGLPGCGSDSKKSDNKTPFIETVQLGAPADYSLADSECQTKTTPVNLTTTTLPSWSGVNITSDAVELNSIVSESSLASNAAFETTYGRIYQRSCTWNQDRPGFCSDRDGEDKGWELTNRGAPLRICGVGTTYPRDSYEGVGLTSMHFLERAHKRFFLETDGQISIPRVSLQILPNFISTFEGYKENGVSKKLTYNVTRNLAYFPVQTGLTYPMIVVWPEPKKKADNWIGGLWESGFVLAHEYGHHIELGALTSSGSKSLAITANETIRWNPRIHGYDDISPDGEAAGGVSQSTQSRKAISEAFADLIGFYTEGDSARGISGMPCFGYNRDVANPLFTGDVEKKLTSEVVFELFEGKSQSDCDGPPSFSDAHLVGAIIAYGTDQLLSQAVKMSGGEPSDKYKLALAWIKALRNQQKDGQAQTKIAAQFPLKAGIEAAVNLHLASIADGRQTLDSAQIKRETCLTFASVFPILDVPAFADEKGNCPANL